MNHFSIRGVPSRLLVALVISFGALVPTAGRAQSLPIGWAFRNIGSPALGGRAVFNGGTFIVDGAGADVWGTGDQFSAVYRRVTGDVTILARIRAVEHTHRWAKAGVMIRESLSARSKHAFVLVSAARGIAFQRRPRTGGASVHTFGGASRAPMWVRLRRRGSTLIASRSADGVHWTRIGTATIPMTSSVYVGIAVTSHNAGSRATARITNVRLTRPASTNPPPPNPPPVVNPPPIPPPVVKPPPVVNPPPAPLKTARFRPSTDHGTSRVTSYRLEIFTVGANPVTSAAIASQNLGKPAVVNGECQANIATTISGLPAGLYFATVRAIGPGGTSPRAASSVFRR